MAFCNSDIPPKGQDLLYLLTTQTQVRSEHDEPFKPIIVLLKLPQLGVHKHPLVS